MMKLVTVFMMLLGVVNGIRMIEDKRELCDVKNGYFWDYDMNRCVKDDQVLILSRNTKQVVWCDESVCMPIFDVERHTSHP